MYVEGCSVGTHLYSNVELFATLTAVVKIMCNCGALVLAYFENPIDRQDSTAPTSNNNVLEVPAEWWLYHIML